MENSSSNWPKKRGARHLKPLGAFDVIAYGVLLVVSVIFFPQGLLAGIAAPIVAQAHRFRKVVAR